MSVDSVHFPHLSQPRFHIENTHQTAIRTTRTENAMIKAKMPVSMLAIKCDAAVYLTDTVRGCVSVWAPSVST